MITNFDIGDKVFLINGYYTECECNPLNTIGIISDFDSYDIYVIWDNGCENSYTRNELKFANIWRDFTI